MEIAMENDISEQYEQSIDDFFFRICCPPNLNMYFPCVFLFVLPVVTSGHP